MISNLNFRKFDFRTDIRDLFELMTDSKDQSLFHGRIQINSLQEFENWMINNFSHNYHVFYVVCSENAIVGYIYSYQFRAYDGHCKVCAFLNKKYRDVGIGAYVGLKFLNELFLDYPIRKIYIDVYDYNNQSLLSNLQIGFVEEGCLKEYRYNNGQYYDLHILSIAREKFFEKAKGYIEND